MSVLDSTLVQLLEDLKQTTAYFNTHIEIVTDLDARLLVAEQRVFELLRKKNTLLEDIQQRLDNPE